MIGLERGTVRLCDHEIEWEAEAARTIDRLRGILGGVICGIEHVGSTSVKTIKAKPIIDIALAVEDFEDILAYKAELLAQGFYYRPDNNTPTQMLFAAGNFYDGSGSLQTHFIHVVLFGSREWQDYLNFRDYLNTHPAEAAEYESLKLRLAKSCTRAEYTENKADFIARILAVAAKNKENL